VDAFLPYLIADLPYEIIMGTTGFLTVLWGYEPLVMVVRISVNQPAFVQTK
jgi:hypothetical protein